MEIKIGLIEVVCNGCPVHCYFRQDNPGGAVISGNCPTPKLAKEMNILAGIDSSLINPPDSEVTEL